MPLFTFTNERGQKRDLLAASHVRMLRLGGHTWRRDNVQLFGVVRGLRAPGQAEEVIAGYRHAEDKHGSRFRSRYSAKTIKKAWATA